MTKGRTKKGKSGSAASNESRALYLYCITERAGLGPASGDQMPEAIEGGAAVEIIEAGDLIAIASEVPVSEYGEAPLHTRLADPAWTAVRAMRHEKVVEHFAALGGVIPLRFATIYLSRERIKEMIACRREELLSIIERLRGREEWGINLCRDTGALMAEITSISPRLGELAGRADKASPGQAYLLRKQIEAMKADEVKAETRRVIEEVERRLAAASEAAARLRVGKDETDEGGEMVAKLAFLVSRERFNEFREAAEQLARDHRAGFRLEMTGPWPAYNFSSAGESK